MPLNFGRMFYGSMSQKMFYFWLIVWKTGCFRFFQKEHHTDCTVKYGGGSVMLWECFRFRATCHNWGKHTFKSLPEKSESWWEGLSVSSVWVEAQIKTWLCSKKMIPHIRVSRPLNVSKWLQLTFGVAMSKSRPELAFKFKGIIRVAQYFSQHCFYPLIYIYSFAFIQCSLSF